MADRPHLDALLHMLGLDANHRDSWRNHYVTGNDDEAVARLVVDGLAEPAPTPGFCARGDRVFRATERGRSVAIAENNRRNPPPKPARGRYLAWLRISDVCPDLTFGDYLRRRMYDDAR